MSDRFLEFIKKHALISPEDKVLLAVSGGVDSMVLMYLFHRAGFDVGVAHCNFSLRAAESDADEALVSNTAALLRIPFFSKSFDTKAYAEEHGVSIQMAARDLRYAWFQTLAASQGYTLIATAHHLEDSFETVVHNLTRGTSVSGLRGIKPRNEMVIRPMLDFTKDEIEQCARQNNISWREDASNQEVYYKRNFIRHQVTPLLKQLNPDLLNTFRDTAKRNTEVEAFFLAGMEQLRQTAFRKHETFLYLPKSKVSGPYVLEHLLKPFGFNYSQCEEMFRAFNEHSGRQFLSKTHRLTVDREELVIDLRELAEFEEQLISAEEGDELKIGEVTYELKQSCGPLEKNSFKEANALLDMEKLQFPLKIRSWREGDQFQPLGMSGKKKLSDFMIDRKIPVNLKRHIRVVESAGEIVWVVGLRIDDRFKVTPKTKTIFSLIRKEGHV
ncbi:MAG: tRNA lysidine(34) synthetase TilS [Roseivirga sp.]|nr:tRNA lysidine(34) synthetase TilS [Roseivirga sp.]